MISQKRLISITLDVECYDDLDVEHLDWRDILQLEPGEDVHYKVKEFDPFD